MYNRLMTGKLFTAIFSTTSSDRALVASFHQNYYEPQQDRREGQQRHPESHGELSLVASPPSTPSRPIGLPAAGFQEIKCRACGNLAGSYVSDTPDPMRASQHEETISIPLEQSRGFDSSVQCFRLRGFRFCCSLGAVGHFMVSKCSGRNLASRTVSGPMCR